MKRELSNDQYPSSRDANVQITTLKGSGRPINSEYELDRLRPSFDP